MPCSTEDWMPLDESPQWATFGNFIITLDNNNLSYPMSLFTKNGPLRTLILHFRTPGFIMGEVIHR